MWGDAGNCMGRSLSRLGATVAYGVSGGNANRGLSHAAAEATFDAVRPFLHIHPVAVVFLLGVAVLAVGLLVWYLAAARLARAPAELGLHDGQLAPCPGTPNCVSTRSADPARRMDPIPYAGSRDAARDRLLAVIRAMPRATVEAVEDGYVRVVFRSAVFRFPDDVEFQLDDDAKAIHFRSASRVGRYDFHVNRRRMRLVGSKM